MIKRINFPAFIPPSLRNLFFLILVPFFVCGCFGSNPGEQHFHKDLGISLRVPDGWERAYTSPMETSGSMAFVDGEGGRIVIMLNYESDFKRQVDIVSEVNYPILQNGALLFSRHKTKWLLSTQDRTSNITYVIGDGEGRTFSIVCTAPSMNFVSYQGSFDRTARSFRLF